MTTLCVFDESYGSCAEAEAQGELGDDGWCAACRGRAPSRALTIRQPWATLIMLGRKTIESRSATTTRRGRVFIHAATTMGPAERKAAIAEGLDPDALTRGAIIGSAEIVGSAPASKLSLTPDERRRGDYRPGRWGWQLACVEALPKPIPCAGALSFWQVPSDVVRAVEAQADARVFVYGSLKRGLYNHRLLTEGATFAGEDRIEGATMFDLGAFPAVHLGGAGAVHGEVYRVTPETLARLDRLEGCPTMYQRVRVRLAASGAASWVYVMTPEKLAGRPGVPSGRWVQKW